MNKRPYTNADMQVVMFDVEDIIATSLETFPTTAPPITTAPQSPTMGPNDTEIL
jgi:hypothetical protein